VTDSKRVAVRSFDQPSTNPLPTVHQILTKSDHARLLKNLDFHGQELLSRIEWAYGLDRKWIDNKFHMRKHEFILLMVRQYCKMIEDDSLLKKLKGNNIDLMIKQIKESL
jgi:hypothetical protein